MVVVMVVGMMMVMMMVMVMGRREKRMRRTWKEGGRRSGARRCEFKTRTQLTGGLGKNIEKPMEFNDFCLGNLLRGLLGRLGD
eukprot:259577-Pyramimonas_sp.AAC.1